VSTKAQAPATKPRVRALSSVLDVLRVEIDHDAFDAALFSLETVAADLGYGDIRALRGSIAWIEQLRALGKRIGLFAAGERAAAALELAGITDQFDEISIGNCTAPTLLAAIEELGSTPERTVVIAATADGVAAARATGAGVVIAVARGFSSPEELRRAGAHTIVADLQELLRAVT
jgi:beta-phosphoglucomutase-like phosphatase (HAD superfamily)